MKVELINYTQNAAELLIFTKSTRLEMQPGLLQEIMEWPEEKKLQELKYMANTIPSSWEFADFTFCITGVSRAFTHQFVRTRQGSYAQQTMRVLNVSGYDYIYTKPNNKENEVYISCVDEANKVIRSLYSVMINNGIAIEDARGILPTNISTNIVAKFNLRTLSEMCKSRTGGRTQNEYQQVMNSMADEVIKIYPWADMFLFQAGRNHYDDLEKFANSLQSNQKTELLKIADKMRKENK